MTALRMRARDVLSEDELVAVRERFTWKGVAMIVHAWTLIVGCDRAGRMVLAFMDRRAGLSACGRHHRLAPAGPRHPHA